MIHNNPKFQKHLKDTIASHNNTLSKGRYGIIMGYDAVTNTATVLLSAPDSDVIGDVIRNIPCPTQIGVQVVAPEPGRQCWVLFKNDRDNNNAIISHYFNQSYSTYDYSKQTNAKSGIPKFMLGI